MTRAPVRGFTLVEVLVALVIVAFGVGALMATLTAAADNTGVLRDRSFAGWVAMNRITEVRLAVTAPGNGKREGVAEFAGERWRWREEITDPRIAGIRRIDVSVWRDGAGTGAAPLALATGFLGTVVKAGNGLDPDFSTDGLRSGPGAPGGAGTRDPAGQDPRDDAEPEAPQPVIEVPPEADLSGGESP